jgi:PleD family two-component response regulator
MSFGLLQTGEWGLKPLEELLHEVDIALYDAKAAGRNCLKLARPAVKIEPVAPRPQSVRLKR